MSTQFASITSSELDWAVDTPANFAYCTPLPAQDSKADLPLAISNNNPELADIVMPSIEKHALS